ncbi:UDP-2,3-diacylglucosamine diphosphatase LpxI [Pelagibacteraceae bacterium]|nr:UDP-2,3-diacylglucosamine diphosphatase LpxI [Pelagibacteraceae bacterium]
MTLFQSNQVEAYVAMKKSRIAFIGGYEPLTAEIFKNSKKKYSNTLFINLSSSISSKEKNIYSLKVYEFSKIVSLLKKFDIKDVCLIGKVNRPNLSNIKIDDVLSKYISQIMIEYKKGDGQTLDLILTILKNEGFKAKSLKSIDNSFYFNESDKKYIFRSNHNDLFDIKKGISLLNKISKYDNAQAVIVSNGYILGIEATEGTDLLLKRVALEKKKLNLINREGILIKISKINQSNSTDNPVIGPKTILNAAKANLNGIAIKKLNTIVFNKAKTIKMLNENKLNLYFI